MNLRAIMSRMRDPVTGNLHLTGAESDHGKFRVDGVVSAIGLLPTPVSVRIKKPFGPVLTAGMDVPVLVDRARPDRFRINWDGVPSYTDMATQRHQDAMNEAARLAERMRTGTAPQAPQDSFPQNSFPQDSFPAGDFSGIADALSKLMQGAAASGGHVHMNRSFEVIHAGFDPARFETAQAEVTVVNELHLPGALGAMVPGGIVDLTLMVTRTDGTHYTAHTRTAFPSPERRAEVAAVGARLQVMINPAHPATVIIPP
jgi:hypothetical protein